MKIFFHKEFEKELQKISKKQQKRVRERIELFLENPYHELLNNHPLKGAYKGYRSINISGDIHALYKFIDQNSVIFVIIGSHSTLYS